MIWKTTAWILFSLILAAGTPYLFQSFHQGWVPLPSETGPPEVLPVLYPEAVVVSVGWFLMYMATSSQLLMLLGLLAGQLTLYFLHADFWIAGYTLPFYGLVAANCLYLLILYFVFSQEKWAPERIRAEEFDPPRNVRE